MRKHTPDRHSTAVTEGMTPENEKLDFLSVLGTEEEMEALIAQRYTHALQQNKAEEYFGAVQRGDAETVSLLLKIAMPADFRHRKTNETGLHIAAACKARDVIRVLIRQPECDFLVRDKRGRLASELAFVYGSDPAVARLLRIKERQQALREGRELTRRPVKVN